MKQAFFILGAEGSGTRMLTQAFIEAGCRGSAEHRQPMDDLDFRYPDEQPIVFHRSLPHGGKWPDLREIADRMAECGYDIVPIFSYRKTDYLVAHQLRTDREHEGEPVPAYADHPEDVQMHLRLAMNQAYGLAAWVNHPLVVVPYEAFVESEMAQLQFFEVLGLPLPKMAFYNANEHERYAAVEALPW